MPEPLITPETKPELLQRLNAAFDSTRAQLGLTNDEAFARRLGVSPKTISFWRNGRWHPAGTALITALIGPPENPSKEAA